MALGQVWIALWAILFIQYVVERLRVAKGDAEAPPAWRNPIAAARSFWRALWDSAALGWGLLAAVVGAHLLACLGLFAWACAKRGFPASLSAAPLTSLLQVRPHDFSALLLRPDFWSAGWRELLDAATLYPIFQMGFAARPMTGIILVAFAIWALQRKSLVSAVERLSPGELSEAYGYLGVGLLALIVAVIFAAASTDKSGGDARLFTAFLTLLSAPVAQGGVLGLISLAFADVALSMPLVAEGMLRRWLRLLPSFALLTGAALLPRIVADLALPGWEADRFGPQPGLAAALWLITRAAWLAVLPLWLWVALHRRPLAEALPHWPAFWQSHWRAIAGALLRAAVMLAPMLLALRVLETLAPAMSLLPGAAIVLGSWLLGFATLGAAMQLYLSEIGVAALDPPTSSLSPSRRRKPTRRRLRRRPYSLATTPQTPPQTIP